MMPRFLLLTLMGLAAWLGLSGVANAAISYTYTTDQTSYSAAQAGQTITVSLYLNENLTSGSQSLLVPDNGLVGFGEYTTQSGSVPTGATTITAEAGNTNPSAPGSASDGFTSNSIYGNRTIAANGSAAAMLFATNNTTGPIGASTANGRQILLGTLTLTAGAAGTTTQFTLETYVNAPTSLGGSGSNNNTVDYGFNDLDVTNNADNGGGATYTGANDLPFETFTVTVAAVPEPNGLVLSGLVVSCGLFGGLGFVGYRRGRAFFLKGNAAA